VEELGRAKMIFKIFLIAIALTSVTAVLQLNCPPKRRWPAPKGCSTFDGVKLTRANYAGLSYVGTDDASKLTKIKFRECDLEFLPADLFNVFPKLTTILVDYYSDLNGEINDGFAKELAPIKKLLIHESEVSKISENAFQQLVNLEEISLTHNELVTLPENVFQNNENLQVVQIDFNFLTHLEPNTFKFNTEIKKILLDHNKIGSLDENLFATLANLEYLNLAFNRLDTLPANLFKNNLNLENIILTRNKIAMLSPDTFKSLEKLSVLDLERNICTNVKVVADSDENADPLQSCYDKWH
jgi:hypothetical protein